MGNREDKYIVTMSVTRTTSQGTETRNLGVMDTFEGGESDADVTQYRRGGLSAHESLGGSKTVGDITTARLYDSFMQEQEPWLEAGVGRADATLTKQPLDDDGNAFGRPRVYTGKLMTLTPPDHDSESSDAARIEFVVSPNGNIG